MSPRRFLLTTSLLVVPLALAFTACSSSCPAPGSSSTLGGGTTAPPTGSGGIGGAAGGPACVLAPASLPVCGAPEGGGLCFADADCAPFQGDVCVANACSLSGCLAARCMVPMADGNTCTRGAECAGGCCAPCTMSWCGNTGAMVCNSSVGACGAPSDAGLDAACLGPGCDGGLGG